MDYIYSNPDAVTLYGVCVQGDEKPRAYFLNRDEAEVFQNEGYFHPFKVAFLHSEIHEFTVQSFKPERRTT